MAWLYGYPNVITGCLEVYAIKIAVGREQVLEGDEVLLECSWHGCPNFDLSKVHRHMRTASF